MLLITEGSFNLRCLTLHSRYHHATPVEKLCCVSCWVGRTRQTRQPYGHWLHKSFKKDEAGVLAWKSMSWFRSSLVYTHPGRSDCPIKLVCFTSHFRTPLAQQCKLRTFFFFARREMFAYCLGFCINGGRYTRIIMNWKIWFLCGMTSIGKWLSDFWRSLRLPSSVSDTA